MATNSRTSRQASAKKAAATRKQATAKRSARATRSSARRTASSARTTSRAAGSAASTRLGVLGRQAERAVLIQIGAATAIRDAVVQTAQTYTSLDRVTRELDRLERRGERAVNRRRRSLVRRRREVAHDVDRVREEIGSLV